MPRDVPAGVDIPRMRILHVLSTSQRRGAEAFAYQLHEALVDRGHASRAIALIPTPSGRALPVDALAARRWDARGIRALRRHALAVDVVIAHGGTTLPACAAALLTLRVPLVYVNIGDPRHWAAGWTRRARVTLMLRRASAVATVSPSGRDALVGHYRFPRSRITVIPNGRKADDYAPVDAAGRRRARERLGLMTDGPVVSTIAALNPEKRVDVAIETIARRPDAMLLVAGDGPEASKLRTLAAARAPNRVRFLGSVENAAPVLAASDACLLTSDSEGVPGALIEAGLMAVPAVATDIGFVRDVVQDGITGRLVPPQDPDATAKALDDVLDLRDKFGSSARAHCLAHFEMTEVTRQWETLLASLCIAAAVQGKCLRARVV